MPWTSIFIFIFTVTSPFAIADPCRFEDPIKGVIDLTSLAATDGRAAYPDVLPTTPSVYKYSYNPCRPFSEGVCANVSACQVPPNGQPTIPIGTQESAQWNAGNGTGNPPTVSYTYLTKRVVVELICSNSTTGVFQVVSETPLNNFRFRLSHKCACWDGCKVPCNASCNATCQRCIGDKCVVTKNACYIAKQCYAANETAKNDSLSCLQCRPDNNQTQWSFNPECSAYNVCSSDFLRFQNTCPDATIKAFYQNPDEAMVNHYNFTECNQDQRACQTGFFRGQNMSHPFACCPGYFCPAGQVCMIPCRAGAYCPSPLPAVDGICQTSVVCPLRQPSDYESYGCGGSTFEGFCPAETYCANPSISVPCLNNTQYCPTGVVEPLPCLSNFECVDGRLHRGYLYKLIIIIVSVFIFVYILIAIIFQWCTLHRSRSAPNRPLNPDGISSYFRKHTPLKNEKPRFQLNIHLHQARLRDVTRFDPERNEGFTGRIIAGRITALMGGSGCGKSSLLDTIHGRRRLRDGVITFAQHKPLTNKLSNYIGYVPQADIMHNDLTVFETVYYSARIRRLRDKTDVIKEDVCFVLDKLGLGNMHNNMIRTLSGGQRKRVNVAMEVVACPKVILLDEPTSGLDTASCDDLMDLLQLIRYSKGGPVAIIMVIHQPSHELFEKIDDIFFLTPLCCLAYQGPREEAYAQLKQRLFESNPERCPPARRNASDTCFIMLTEAQEHIENHEREHQGVVQHLQTDSWPKRAFLPFFYVLSRSAKQIYVRGFIAESAYLLAYFLLGACIGYLFENRQQDACSIEILPTIYFLISLAFGILTCISSQRLFGVEIIDKTYERESRTHFHPVQYWLAKSVVDILRLLFYPLIFLSMLYIEIVPRAAFGSYFLVIILLSFVCSGVGQFASVIFNRTEYAYLGGTIIALLSCLLSGFSPRKSELGRAEGFVTISFSRHVQHLLFDRETSLYVQEVATGPHIWAASVEALRTFYSFSDDENPYLWLAANGLFLRLITLMILYVKSEYRSSRRFGIANAIPSLKGLFRRGPRRERSEFDASIQY